ncbi:MAG: hypothetical protein AB7I34_04075 [Rhizobiaceae bacterium]
MTIVRRQNIWLKRRGDLLEFRPRFWVDVKLQASVVDCLPFNPFALFGDGNSPAEVGGGIQTAPR